MAVTPTYPGVYVEELPSGVRTITGVATSITALIGRTRRGPDNEPVRVQSFGEFERLFGGLWFHSTLSYAVRHFFQNGGGDALIIRVTHAESAVLALETGGDPLRLQAAAAGPLGDRLEAEVTTTGTDRNVIVREIVRVGGNDITVGEATYTADDIGDLIDAINNDGMLVTVDDGAVTPAGLPNDAGVTSFAGGDDGASAARAPLAVTAETLTLTADAVGVGGNDFYATVIHASTNDDAFVLLIEEIDAAGTVTTSEVHDVAAVANLGAALSLAGNTLLDSTVVATAMRPAEVTRAQFSDGDAATAATLALTAPTEILTLSASSPGAWGNALRVVVDHNTADPTNPEIFNLTVEELDRAGNVRDRELFRNVSLDETAPRYVERVLELESALVEIAGALPATRPLAMTTLFSHGSDGGDLADADLQGSQADKTGLYALEDADLFNMLCIPPISRDADVGTAVLAEALAYCQAQRAILILDPPRTWTEPPDAEDATNGAPGLRGTLGTAQAINAALYFPRLRMPDPLQENRLATFAPCGAVAGIIARTDAQRGVWKAPAGIDASFSGVREFTYRLTDGENGRLNPLGVNCFRTFSAYGNIVWGARTLAGDDRLASEWKYVPVRRTALYIEESLYRGLHWAVFEPNDEGLWGQIRLNVGAFMHNLFRQGAFQGITPRDAYLVKCDRETNPQNLIDQGIVTVLVGFAPLKPAEFVVIQIQQLAGQLEV